MFRCAITGKITKPKDPMTRVVLETRQVVYTNRVYDELTGKMVETQSKGTEIVREVGVGPEGMKVLMERTAQ